MLIFKQSITCEVQRYCDIYKCRICNRYQRNSNIDQINFKSVYNIGLINILKHKFENENNDRHDRTSYYKEI